MAFVAGDPWKVMGRVKLCEHRTLELRPNVRVYECTSCKRRWPKGITASFGYFAYLSTMVPFSRPLTGRRRLASNVRKQRT